MQKILLAAASETDRSLLYEIFAPKYELLMTESSEEAYKLLIDNKDELAVVIIADSIASRISQDAARTLLSLKLFDLVPVLILLESGEAEIKQQSFHFPISDVLGSPVNPFIAKKRVSNLIEAYTNRIELEKLVSEQTKKILEQNRALKEQQKKINTINNDMLDTLSMMIEYRDVESGRHIHRIRKFTEVLLRILAEKYPQYNLTEDKIEMITSASSMHDIGKIAIPDSILLSPKRLTYDEFRIMKQHTVKGCEILEQLDSVEKNEYYKYCYDICRYHHEKWDGTGYPDGLVGDQIPIWAQVVSLSDCYDALTSERPYKTSYTHEQAVEMIRTGACGAFSDVMLDCFSAALPRFRELAVQYADPSNADRSVSDKAPPARRGAEGDHSRDIYLKMDREALIDTIEHQKKNIAELQKIDREVLYKLNDLVVEFDIRADILYERKGSLRTICGYVPKNYEETINVLSENCSEDFKPIFAQSFRTRNMLELMENGEERIVLECSFDMGRGEYSHVRCGAIPVFENDRLSRIFFAVTELREGFADRSISGDKDIITGLWNYTGVKREIDAFLANDGKNGSHALVMIDIDDFRTINRQAGYRFGSEILCDITNLLKYRITGSNILGRIEDDSFVIFINDCPDKEQRSLMIEDIFRCIHKTYISDEERLPDISASVGIALYPADGSDFDELFENARRAVEIAELNGRNMYLYYNKGMRESWELQKFDSSLRVVEKNELEVTELQGYFIPVVDSASGFIMSYDVIGVSGRYMSRLVNMDTLMQAALNSENVAALSLNSVDKLLSMIAQLEMENTAMPELSILTVFDGSELDTIVSAFAEMLEKNPVDSSRICIMLSHDMIEQLSVAELTDFASQIKSLGFMVGIYNVGIRSINVNCFIENLFDKVVFAKRFIQSVTDGVYDPDIMINLLKYFDKLGTKTVLPGGISSDFVSMLKERSPYSFGYHKDEFISINDFRLQMKASSVIKDYPVLSHEKTSLVLNDKMYDEILEQTKSFIIEWSPRFDKIKISGSFARMYGYRPEPEDFFHTLTGAEFIHPDDQKKFAEKMNSARSEQIDEEAFVRIYNKRDDKYLWNRARFVTIKNSEDVPTRIMAVFTDISDNRTDGPDESRKDRTDFITNLYNKHATENKIKNYLYDEGSDGSHALLMVEICGFDTLERELGFVFANAVLKEVAGSVRELFRDSDIIGRGSGSRFTVFVKGMDARNKIREKCAQICRAINNKYQSDAGEISVYGKIGISLYPRDGSTYDELYEGALKALYFAKHSQKLDAAFVSDVDGSIPKLLHE